jgi:hypothetical protein
MIILIEKRRLGAAFFYAKVLVVIVSSILYQAFSIQHPLSILAYILRSSSGISIVILGFIPQD